jgi:purine-binding chemotaxis protein CheW
MNPAHGRHDRAADLRLEFDRTFAAPAAAPPATVDLLAVQVAGEGYALRLAGIAGLFADRRIVPLPGAAAELLGLAGLRGGLVAIYDLGAILGHTRSESPRWVALARGEKTVGLAFDELGGFMRVALQDLTQGAGAAPTGRYVREVVHVDGGLRPVVDMASILETIEGLSRQASRSEER